jgi:DNA polymerase
LHENFFLNRFATNVVIGDGQENADILLIGEAPGEAEDESGIPFCGRSGQLLEKALASIGLSRNENIYITNTVFWRPENNRKPTKEELEFCLPLLMQIIQIINPKIIITSGSVSTELLLKDKNAISELIGKASEVELNINSENKKFHCFPIYHPSYLLRNPISKKILWENLLILKHFLRPKI